MFSLDNEEEDTLEHYITVSRARDRDAVDKEIEAARMLAAVKSEYEDKYAGYQKHTSRKRTEII